MKVWIVERGAKWEGGQVEAVYASRRAALLDYELPPEGEDEIFWDDVNEFYIAVKEFEVKE